MYWQVLDTGPKKNEESRDVYGHGHTFLEKAALRSSSRAVSR